MGETVLQLAAVALPMAKETQPMHLAVAKGDVWVVDGPSGSGKTTLFKVMSGLLQPHAGEVSLFGHVISTIHFRQLNRLRQRIGVLLEGDGLIPSWTVFENLALPWRYHDLLQSAQLEPYLHELLLRYQENTGILHRVTATLSVEQRLRIALMRTVQRDPELLILDNDSVAFHLSRLLQGGLAHRLDAESVAIVVRGGAALVRTFPRERVHLALLDNGNLVASGKLADLQDHPESRDILAALGY